RCRATLLLSYRLSNPRVSPRKILELEEQSMTLENQGRIPTERGSKAAPLKIGYHRLSELKLDPRNPRRHSKKQIQQIARSIAAFGFNTPCIVDEQLRVVSGHGRLAAAKLLGISEVPTVLLTHLSELQVRAFQIADNRVGELSTWDKSQLAEHFETLLDITLDFNLESTGFDLGEIQLLVENRKPVPRTKRTTSEELSCPEANETVTRTGDMWVL